MDTSDLHPLYVYYSWNEKAYPADSMRMTFVSNHDKNAWEGTEFEQFGDGLDAAVVLSVVGDGMPLIYNGQEAGNTKRIEFFDRDPIEWREHPSGDLYRRRLLCTAAGAPRGRATETTDTADRGLSATGPRWSKLSGRVHGWRAATRTPTSIPPRAPPRAPARPARGSIRRSTTSRRA